MTEPVSNTTAGRIAAILFIVSGAVTVLSLLLPAPPTMNPPAVAAVGCVAILGALPAWFLPWERLPRRASLLMVVMALPLISVHNIFGGSDPYRWSLYYVVLSAWVGLAHPRGTFLLIGPFMAASYVLPLLLPGHPVWALSSSLYAIPVCGLVAETSAWAISRAGQAQQALIRSEAQLRHLAHHDSLTGLSNRADFQAQLDAALQADASSGLVCLLGLLFIDIDDFKLVNDRYGHGVGDEILCEVARRLSASVRPGDAVARLGGDEFTVLLPVLQTPGEGRRIAERISRQFAAPVEVADATVRVNASIGLAIANSGTPPEELLRRADAAMYQAKQAGKGGWVLLDLAA